jgi:hypothetical protein
MALAVQVSKKRSHQRNLSPAKYMELLLQMVLADQLEDISVLRTTEQ